MRCLYIIGDSVMKGVVYDPDNNKFTVDKEMAEGLGDLKFDSVENLSSFGCTIDKGAAKIDKLIESKKEPGIILIEFGGNDCDFMWNEISAEPDVEHLPKTPLDKFKGYYEESVRKMIDNGVKPYIMNLPPIDAKKYFNRIIEVGKLSADNILHWLGDVQMIYRFQEMYSTASAFIAEKMKWPIVDVRTSFLEKHNFINLICEDGIHPNVKGHRLIVNAIASSI